MSNPYMVIAKAKEHSEFYVHITANPLEIQKSLQAAKDKPEEFECFVYSLDSLPRIISMEIEVNEVRQEPHRDQEI